MIQVGGVGGGGGEIEVTSQYTMWNVAFSDIRFVRVNFEPA